MCWEFSPSSGASSGLLMIQDPKAFDMNYMFMGRNFVRVKGMWKDKICESAY